MLVALVNPGLSVNSSDVQRIAREAGLPVNSAHVTRGDALKVAVVYGAKERRPRKNEIVTLVNRVSPQSIGRADVAIVPEWAAALR